VTEREHESSPDARGTVSAAGSIASRPVGADDPARVVTRWRPHVACEAVVYALVALWWLWPLPLHLADHAIYPRSEMPEVAADYHLIVWALAWDTHALLTHPGGLFDANIFFPAPRALAFSEHFLGYVPLFAPTYLVTGNPVLAANVLLLLTYPACGLAMAALARRFVSPPAALAAGLLFAFCGIRYDNLYHFHQLGTFWLPAALLFTDRWLERARKRDAAALGVCFALQLLSSYYLGYALVVLYGVALPVLLWRWSGALERRRLVGLAAAIVLGALPAAIASLPYLEMQRLGLVPAAGGAQVASLFTMDPRVTMLQIQRYLTADGIGPVGWLLALLALLVGWRTGRHARVLGLVAGLSGLLLAAGPRVYVLQRRLWSPYGLLQRWLPGFAAIRLPFRFLVVAQLGWALLAALGLEQVLARLPRRLRWPTGIAISGLALLVLAPSRAPHTLHHVPSGAGAPPVYHWLRDHGQAGAVLEVPNGDAAVASRRMLLGTTHWLPMLDGYSAYPPLTRNFLRRIAAGLPEESALQGLVDVVAVRWVVVHLDELEPAARRRWEAIRVPGLRLVERFGDDLLFAVERPVVNDHRARLVSTQVTLSGVPLAPVARDCRGRLQVALLEQRVLWAPGSKLPLAVQIDNASALAWPGTGFYPRYLVKLRARFESDAGVEELSSELPLWADVPRGESIAVLAEVDVPSRPGSYRLVLDLVQDGVPFASCGLETARLAVQVASPGQPARSPRRS